MPSPEHAAYVEAAPSLAQTRLNHLSELVHATIPQAEACIGYQMPAFRDGKIFFYFGAFKHHIGIYPPLTTQPDLQERLERWRGPKGNLKLAYADDMPWDLLAELVRALHAQYAG